MTGNAGMERRGREGAWIPWAFVGGFAVMIVANGSLVYAALTSWTGIETEQAYQRGLEYNQAIAAGRRQDKLGWQGTVRRARDASGRNLLQLTLRDANGQPLTGASAEARMVRPTSEGHDFTLALSDRGDGVYAAPFLPPLAGQWEARVMVERGHDRFRVDARMVVPDER